MMLTTTTHTYMHAWICTPKERKNNSLGPRSSTPCQYLVLIINNNNTFFKPLQIHRYPWLEMKSVVNTQTYFLWVVGNVEVQLRLQIDFFSFTIFYY